MDILEKLKALNPERRRSVIKILLDQAIQLQLKPEVELLTVWYNEDPFEIPSNPRSSKPATPTNLAVNDNKFKTVS